MKSLNNFLSITKQRLKYVLNIKQWLYILEVRTVDLEAYKNLDKQKVIKHISTAE